MSNWRKRYEEAQREIAEEKRRVRSMNWLDRFNYETEGHGPDQPPPKVRLEKVAQALSEIGASNYAATTTLEWFERQMEEMSEEEIARMEDAAVDYIAGRISKEVLMERLTSTEDGGKTRPIELE